MSRWDAQIERTTERAPARSEPVVIGSHAFTRNARAAIQANPDYFVWWYTVKSMLLVVAIGVASFFAGKAGRS